MLNAENRLAAAREVADLGETQAAIVYLTMLVSDDSAACNHRAEAVLAIAELGDIPAAVEAFFTLDTDDEPPAKVAQQLLDLGDATPTTVDNLSKIINQLGEDLDLDINECEYRIRRARQAAQMGDTESAISILRVILTDIEMGEEYYQFTAASELANLGDIETAVDGLLYLVTDGLEFEYSLEAALRLLELQYTEAGANAIETINALAAEIDIDPIDPGKYRIRAAKKIAAGGDAAAAIRVLMVLAEDEDELYWDGDRLRAAVTIAELGDTTGALNILAALAEGDDIDEECRSDAIQEIVKVAVADPIRVLDPLTIVATDVSSPSTVRMTAAKALLDLGEPDVSALAFVSIAEDLVVSSIADKYFPDRIKDEIDQLRNQISAISLDSLATNDFYPRGYNEYALTRERNYPILSLITRERVARILRALENLAIARYSEASSSNDARSER